MLTRGSRLEQGLQLSHHGRELGQAGVLCAGGTGQLYLLPQIQQLVVHMNQFWAVLHPEAHLIQYCVESGDTDPV